MFVSNEKGVAKKTFQKPNILRRKPKVSIPRHHTSNIIESPKTQSLVTTTYVEEVNNGSNYKGWNKPANVNNTEWTLTIANNYENKDGSKTLETDIDVNINSNTSACSNITQTKNEDKSLKESSLNIESFLNGGDSEQTMIYSNVNGTITSEKKTTQTKSKWCFDISNHSMDLLMNNYSDPQLGELEQKLDSVIVVPSAPTSDIQQSNHINDQVSSLTIPKKTIAVDCISNRAVKFKCDHPTCNKGFWSEERLRKHKNSHNRQIVRTPSQTTVECPVKKIIADGIEERCPRTFPVRCELLKHLNEEHTLEDAQHRCDVCGRRFFFASGLRAHGTSVCARGGLACAWPGCGRVFRLPCRLREHARSHTGDRPYLCRYPDCGWAFRSASKLVRHARRHTDERKHACSACDRAFLRREHLRDHYARHHQLNARTTHHCTHPGCEQTFSNMSTLYAHMKKVHRQEPKDVDANHRHDEGSTVMEDTNNIYLVSLVTDAKTEEDASSAAESSVNTELDVERTDMENIEWHAARTHCTWPLTRYTQHNYVLDDDVQVERTEGSGSDVYTVRSDLFLHGNVSIDDDSQHIVGAEEMAEVETVAPLDSDLCLIDPHPTIDLMQEELMYEDAAVDESSFRVFLMNGEELT